MRADLDGPLPRAFYERDCVEVARDLLGTLLLRRCPDGRVLAGRVVETEAYSGPDDQASHAHGGPTPRSAIMYGPPGFAYVYQIYGVWFCLNAVTGSEGFPAAVLIRAVAPVPPPEDVRAAAGPGKLCALLGIDKRLNGEDLVRGATLAFVDDGTRPAEIAAGTRIGVGYAGAWAGRPWRFWVAGDPSVSRLPPRRTRAVARRRREAK